jgi:hypothetical protein
VIYSDAYTGMRKGVLMEQHQWHSTNGDLCQELVSGIAGVSGVYCNTQRKSPIHSNGGSDTILRVHCLDSHTEDYEDERTARWGKEVQVRKAHNKIHADGKSGHAGKPHEHDREL